MADLGTIANRLLGAIRRRQGGTARKTAFGVLDRIWQRNDMDEGESMKLAVEAQHRTRRRR